MNTDAQPTRHRWIAAALIVAVAILSVLCVKSSLQWLGTTFPGFFILDNRVVASVSLPHWPVAVNPQLFQQEIVAVNGQLVFTPDEIYRIVRQLPRTSLVTYTVEKNGYRSEAMLPSRTFAFQDYFLLFGAALLTGITTALLGIIVWLLKPNDLAARTLSVSSLALGVFSLTVLDLYGPARWFRLHAACEALFPLGFVYLGLVFPVNYLRRFYSIVLAVLTVATAALVMVYELVLYEPARYTTVHNFCTLNMGLGGLALVGGGIVAYATTASHLVRQRLRVILLGSLGGLAFPSILMGYSGLMGGEVAVNYSAFTAFFFPLSIGYAVVKHDLFEIDAFLKRGTYYLTLTTTLTLAYVAFLALLNMSLRSSELAHSPFFPLLFTLAVALFLNPLKDLIQRALDRVFFRLRYDPQKVLDATSASLAATLRLDDILANIWRTICETLGLTRGGIFLVAAETAQYVGSHPAAASAQTLAADHPLVSALRQHGRLLSLYDIADGVLIMARPQDCLRAFDRLQAQLLVPLVLKGDLLGFFALGAKESGAFFSAADRDFLSTFANQSALSIANARAYTAIEDLNAGLEGKVEERTQELAKANNELQTSLTQLELTYHSLQRSQESLLRAEKMAALGRLTAGIAHEMNTPLGASLSSLKIVKALVDEYKASITDPIVTSSDHQQIAAEMDTLVQATQQWMEKAAAHIRSLKLHTRDLKPGEEKPFSVVQAIDDTGLLLAHRLRQSQCTLTVSASAKDPFVYGDPSKMGQVLTNLIANAIDAYKGANEPKNTIDVTIAEDGNFLQIRVQDYGCGIAPEDVGKIFDDFFSTKPLGEGTGLGLSISRDIVTNFFGGTLAVESSLGRGSVFTLRLPRTYKRDELHPITTPSQDQLEAAHHPEST